MRPAELGVVVPAHDGEKRLHRSLRALTGQRDVRLSVVVAVNGPRDKSLDVAKWFAPDLRNRGHRVAIVETGVGRAMALNAAEKLLPETPRLFLDQDAILSPDAAKMLAETLRSGSGVHFAAPRLALPSGLPPLASAYFDFWRRLPYVVGSPVTIGAYAVSVDGRKRWGEFPALHSDDKFVRLHFALHERHVVDATYEVVLPLTTGAIVSARRRYLRGNRELASRYPALVAADRGRISARGTFGWRQIVTAPVFVGLYGNALAAEALANRHRSSNAVPPRDEVALI